jgi:site-specific DNA recombinase
MSYGTHETRNHLAEWNRLQAEASAHEGTKRRELDVVRRKLDGFVNAIAGGLRAPGLQQKLDELEARKSELEGALQATPPSGLLLHPKLADVYRQRVEHLQYLFVDSPNHSVRLR